MNFKRTYTDFWSDYELLDAGGGKKLERFGEIIAIRPELQAYFKSELPFAEWDKMAHVSFKETASQKGNWSFLKANTPKVWNINLMDDLSLKMKLELTQFKHVGLFPEQQSNWQMIRGQLNPDDAFLNLFAYTGAASLVARSQGAKVTHVDSVKQLVSWSKENMELSALSDIRWIVDDALKFAEKEVKRGNKYKGIIMDPPAFGLGAKGEKWILEQRLPDLLRLANDLLLPDGFLIVNTYSPKISCENLNQLAKIHFKKRTFEISELWMNTKTEKEMYFGNLLRVNC